MSLLMQERFQEKLVKTGLVEEGQIEQALLLQKREGGELSDILVGLGYLSETQVQQCIAEVQEVRFYTLEELLALPFGKRDSELLSYSQALQEMILPIFRGEVLEIIALRTFEGDEKTRYKHRFSVKELRYGVATHQALLQAIRYHYGRFLLESLEKGEEIKAAEAQSVEAVVPDLRHTSQIRLRQERLCPTCAYPYEPNAEICPKCSTVLKKEGIPDPLLGLVIEKRWQLVKQLGEGGMGMVYRAHDLEMKDDCAIKLLHLSEGLDPKVIQRFEKEARILQELHHPNILSVRAFGQHPAFGFYLVMEFLKGCNLHEYTKEKKEDLTLEEVADILGPVCLAMDYAHDHGVIHRDIKPENIFLQQHEGRLQSVKVIDFGIARRDNRGTRLTSTGMMIGTPRYISPEQILGKETDSRSDIYSLSVILFELLTRRDLYDADNVYEYLMRHIYAQPPPLSHCRPDRRYPLGLERLVLLGLSKAPGERPATMRLFRQMLLEGCYAGAATPIPAKEKPRVALADTSDDIWEEAKPISEPYQKSPPAHHAVEVMGRPVLGRRLEPSARSMTAGNLSALPIGGNPALSSAIAALPPRQPTAASLPALPVSLPPRKASGPQVKTTPRSALLESPKKRRWLHLLLLFFLVLPVVALGGLALAPDSTHRAIYTAISTIQAVLPLPLTTAEEKDKGKKAWKAFGSGEGLPRYRLEAFALPPPDVRPPSKRSKKPPKKRPPPRREEEEEEAEE